MIPSAQNKIFGQKPLRAKPAGLFGEAGEREDKIWKLLHGGADHDWFNDPPNTWRLAWESAPAQIDRPMAMLINVPDPFDLGSDVHDMALIWDDEIQAVPLQVVEEGKSYLVELPEVKGNQLAIWLAAKGGFAEPLPISVTMRPLEEAPLLRAEAGAPEKDEESLLEQLGGYIGKRSEAGDTNVRVLGIAAIMVAGLVGYLLIKTAD